MINKELLAKTLKFLKEEPELRDLTINQIEERFYAFESLLTSLIEDALGDEEDIVSGTLTGWWLYDSCPKIIYIDDSKETKETKEINVESAEDFVNYMTERNEQ